MIIPQFTYNKAGEKTGVFLTIEDWEQLEKVPGVEEIAHNEPVIPAWHLELVKKELENIATGNTELIEWEEAKKQFKLYLAL